MRDKSGISPVIATLLLIVIAVAAAIIVYAWTTMFTTMQTGRAGAIIATETVDIPKNFVTPATAPKLYPGNISRLYNDRRNYTIAVTVRNIGSTDVAIINVYLNGTLVTQNATARCWTEVWNYTTGRPLDGNYGWQLGAGRRTRPDTQWWMPETTIAPGYSATVYIVDAWLQKGHSCTVRVVTSQGAYSDISFYPP